MWRRSWKGRAPILTVSAASIIAILSWQSAVQTSYWRDSETLWRRALAVTANNDVTHTNLSQVLLASNRPGEALTQAEAAVAIRPDNASAYNNLGVAARQTGDVARAVRAWQRSLQLRPGNVNAEANLAWVLATSPDDSLRNGAEAVRLAEDANARIGRTRATFLRTLAAAYAEAGRFHDATTAATGARRLALAEGDTLLASNLEFQIRNYANNLRMRDPTLGRNAKQSDTPAAEQ